MGFAKSSHNVDCFFVVDYRWVVINEIHFSFAFVGFCDAVAYLIDPLFHSGQSLLVVVPDASFELSIIWKDVEGVST